MFFDSPDLKDKYYKGERHARGGGERAGGIRQIRPLLVGVVRGGKALGRHRSAL